MIPTKKVVKIGPDQLPEPFASYWHGRVPDHEPLERDYEFFLVDGELYIKDKEEFGLGLLQYWSDAGCCGVKLYADSLGLPEHSKRPLVAEDGHYLFMVKYTDSYETSAETVNGRSFVVHSG